MSTLLGIAVFSFWMWLYPQDLAYQEQNQLFLFTWDYLRERILLPGGLADYLSEFLVQLFYVRVLGAIIMALLAISLQLAVWKAAGKKRSLYALSFIPSLLVLVYQGDVDVLMSFPVALLMSTSLCPLFEKADWNRLWLIPLGWWLVGPMIALPILLSVIRGRKWQDLVMLIWLGTTFYAEYRFMAAQYPLRDAIFGINYYRLVESLPVLQWVIPIVTLASILLCSLGLEFRHDTLANSILLVILAIGAWGGVSLSYDKDTQETLAYDWLIRNKKYSRVLARARKYQPRNPVSASAVNLCLFLEGQLTEHFMEYYQCGTEGLILPSIRDNLSDSPSAEALWMMGMPNITLQYSFDLQESIQNGRKSGRFTARIAECNIVNGWYDRASHYLGILEKSLFYRQWAKERKAMILEEPKVMADPYYSYIRSVRFKEDFITQYDSLDLMMALLYNQNKNNYMAAEYYTVWQKLKSKEE